jgi:phosphoenolpyruvate carboxylase
MSRSALEDNFFEGPLQLDLSLLGNILLEVILECKNTSPQVHSFLESALSKIITSSEEYSKTHSEQTFQELVQQTSNLSLDEAKATAKAFHLYLDLSNIAERIHRVRRWRQYKSGKGNLVLKQTITDCFNILREKGVSMNEIRETLIHQSIELVLTAHPTQAARRTTLAKYAKIALYLECFTSDASEFDKAKLRSNLKREIVSTWKSNSL